MQQHLFVYGTLGPNKPNAHILEVIAGTWSKGSVKGLLKEAGWGAELGFPGLMLNSDGQTVDGYIFSLVITPFLSKSPYTIKRFFC